MDHRSQPLFMTNYQLDYVNATMFKFDFDLDDGILSSTSEIHPLPPNKSSPSPQLEPFTEIHVDRLVRGNL